MLNRQIRAREIERIGKELSQTENNKFRDTQFNKFYSDKWKPKYTKKHTDTKMITDRKIHTNRKIHLTKKDTSDKERYI